MKLIATILVATPLALPALAPGDEPTCSVIYHMTVQAADGKAPLDGATLTLRSEELRRDEKGHATEIPGSSKVVATATTNAWGYAEIRYRYLQVEPPYASRTHAVYMIEVGRKGYRSKFICPEGPCDFEGITGKNADLNLVEIVRAARVELRKAD